MLFCFSFNHQALNIVKNKIGFNRNFKFNDKDAVLLELKCIFEIETT